MAPSTPLSVFTWNINLFTGTAATLNPLARLSPRPDVVTLQEVVLERAIETLERLGDMGYAGVTYSGRPDASEKHYGNIIAARTPLTSCDPAAYDFPWTQLVGHAVLDASGGPINVVTVHVPNGSGNGWKKIDTLDALKQLVLGLKGKPLILTGDFNEPQYAMQDGQVVTWGQEQAGGRWEVWDGEWTDKNGVTDEWGRWDSTARWFFGSPEESGIRSAFWDVAGHGTMEATHLVGDDPRWFDHVFVSDSFKVNACDYLHTFREEEFSDHSALLATLSYSTG
jgi:endonuclease/exonuclease/phosphatase family metal-dependent hydrolase